MKDPLMAFLLVVIALCFFVSGLITRKQMGIEIGKQGTISIDKVLDLSTRNFNIAMKTENVDTLTYLKGKADAYSELLEVCDK